MCDKDINLDPTLSVLTGEWTVATQGIFIPLQYGEPSLSSNEQAVKVSNYMYAAYAQGYQDAKADIRKALGVDDDAS